MNTLVRLTGAKTVANTALRWIPLFLPTLERAFGASTTQLTTVIGAGELGRVLDDRVRCSARSRTASGW